MLGVLTGGSVQFGYAIMHAPSSVYFVAIRRWLWNTVCPSTSKAAVTRLFSQTSAPAEYVNWPGNLSFDPVEMSPATRELPFASKPAPKWGATLARYDQTTNGLTPTAPAPRKLSESPVGSRTSVPIARPARSPFQTAPLTRRTMSPIPLAPLVFENDWLRQFVMLTTDPQPGLVLNAWVPLPELSMMVASETILILTSWIGMATETSTRLVRPKVIKVVTWWIFKSIRFCTVTTSLMNEQSVTLSPLTEQVRGWFVFGSVITVSGWVNTSGRRFKSVPSKLLNERY